MVESNPRHTEDPHASWKTLFKNWKLAICLSIGFFSGFFVLIIHLTPLYKAHVAILLPFMSSEDPTAQGSRSAQAQADAFVVRSYKSIVEDPGICQQVIDRLRLDAVGEFKPKPSFLAPFIDKVQDAFGVSKTREKSLISDADVRRGMLLDMYQDRLESKNDAKSLILDLSFEAENPYLAASIVNAHAAAFVSSEVNFRRQEAQTRADWMKSEIEGAAGEVRDAQVAIQMRQTELGSSRETAARQAAESRSSEMFVASKRAVYEDFLAKHRAILAEQHYGGSGIRVLSPAVVPARPAFPRKLILGAAAAVLSVFLGFAFAAIFGVIGRKETIDRMGRDNGIPVLGWLNVSGRRLMAWPGRAGQLARTCFWEQIRLIRSALLLEDNVGSAARCKVVVVTSAMRAEGKSLTAAALARSFASSGTRTLLIDLNLRKPSFYAPAERAFDLDTYLRGKSDFAQSVTVPDKELPLYVMGCAASKHVVHSDATTGPRMRELIDRARETYDAVIVDTPAVTLVSDALFVAAVADRVVIAAMERRSSLDAIQTTIDLFRRRGVPICGLILCRRFRPDRSTHGHLLRYLESERLSAVWPTPTHEPFLRFPRRPRLSAGAASQMGPTQEQKPV